MSGPDSPVHAAKTGDVIAGKYRIEGVLGSGGMAIVLSATQLDLDRLVAIKVMRTELAETPGAVERLLLEAKLTARFRNEHICKVLDVGTLADGAPYVVMEYLEGSDLHVLLEKRGPFDISTAVDFMLQACEGIAEAHAADIIHRDLKPENLFVTNLLDETPTVKVLDFGISKQLGSRPTSRALTNPSTALGSPHYMAPEQMLSAKDVDLRADLWALGAILFELLTGRTAFEGDTLPEVCAAVISVAPKRATELRPDVPPVLADVIDRCLQKAPADRFSSVAEFATRLLPFGSFRAASSLKRIERVLGRSTPGSGLSARQLSLPARIGTTDAATMVDSAPPPRSSKRIVVAATFALVLGAIGIVGVVRGKGQTPRSDQPASAATQFSLEEAPLQALTTVTQPTPPPAPTPEATPAAPPSDPSRTAQPETHASHARSQPRTARPATTPSVAPVPADTAKSHKATDAWDPNSFGPRR
jgi:eukaryotic-like serine/threonine-protein kinase